MEPLQVSGGAGVRLGGGLVLTLGDERSLSQLGSLVQILR